MPTSQTPSLRHFLLTPDLTPSTAIQKIQVQEQFRTLAKIPPKSKITPVIQAGVGNLKQMAAKPPP